MIDKMRPIVLAGGTGTRLWPLSTEERPKQFIPMFKEFSLFDLTLQRLNNRSLFKNPIIVTSEKYLDYVNKSLLLTGTIAEKIILEPEAKNTGPAITMAVMLALKEDSSENFFVAPSDHYISINKNFYDSCFLSLHEAKKGGLILMGVKPDRPSTEYGYILINSSTEDIKSVSKFMEKPDLETSKNLIADPCIFWNAGMFIFNGNWLLKSLETVNADLFQSILDVTDLKFNKSNLYTPDVTKFKKLKNISFDVGFVEKNIDTSMITLEAGWSDLGSWVALSELQREPEGSMTLYSEGLYDRHERPWGFFATLMETETSKVKLLSVSPGEKLSLQKHQKRAETWHVVRGTARVTKGSDIFSMQIGDSTIIEKNQVHRLENDKDEPLEVIEIQTGSYFGEDDITRLNDIYGRIDLQ